jgi:hypothetical protein
MARAAGLTHPAVAHVSAISLTVTVLLAAGVYARSRAAAAVLLVFFAYAKARQLAAGFVGPVPVVLFLAVGSVYLQALRGTLRLHQLRSLAAPPAA